MLAETMRRTSLLLLLMHLLSNSLHAQTPPSQPDEAYYYGQPPSNEWILPGELENQPPLEFEVSEEPPPKKRTRQGGGMGGPFGGSGGPGYGIEWFPTQSVRSQDVNFQLVDQNASAGMPLWSGDFGTFVFTFGVQNTHAFTDAILPDTGRAFPEDLWDVKFGLTYIRQFDNGSTLGVITGLGSASDKPFHSADEMNVSLITFLRKPARNERDAWMFGVMYSPSGSLNFPVPILAYEWNRSDAFQMNIGVPLSVTWRPRENWTLNASYVPLTTGNVILTHDLSENWHVYGGYRSIADSYFLSDRVEEEDRFFALQQRLVTGVRWDVGKYGALDFSAGYAFDRRYGEGSNQGATWHDEVEVDPGAFVGLDFRLLF